MLAALESHGEIDRVDLAAEAGLTQTVASQALRALLDSRRVVEESGILRLAIEQDDTDGEAVWVTVTRRFSLSSWRELGSARVPRIEGDDLSGESLDGPVRAALKVAGVEREPREDDAARLARLAAFAQEHGCGQAAWNRWKDEGGEPAYGRQSFHRACQRALESPERRVARVVTSHVKEARTEGKREAVISMSALLDAASGRKPQP